jgi:hypothetical protein
VAIATNLGGSPSVHAKGGKATFSDLTLVSARSSRPRVPTGGRRIEQPVALSASR